VGHRKIFALKDLGKEAMSQPVIESLMPGAGIEGGEVVITCRNFNFSRRTIRLESSLTALKLARSAHLRQE
jgi:hypothetical protein